MRRSAPGASRRSRSQTQAPGGQGWRRGRGSAHGNIIARTGVPRRYAPSPSRARFSASAAPCPAAPAAEDGVGDLHPLGIGIVAVGQDHQSQVAARDERHVGAEAVGGTGLVRRRRWPSSACGAAAWRSCAVAAPSASSCRPAGASGRSASRRLPSPGPGSCRRPCSNRDGWHRAPAPGPVGRSGCRLASTKRSRSAALVFTRSLRHPAGRDRPVAGGRPCRSPGRTAPAPPRARRGGSVRGPVPGTLAAP